MTINGDKEIGVLQLTWQITKLRSSILESKWCFPRGYESVVIKWYTSPPSPHLHCTHCHCPFQDDLASSDVLYHPLLADYFPRPPLLL